jgi:hypothetical protein
LRHPTANVTIPLTQAVTLADVFLSACKIARDVLPKLKTGTAFGDALDDNLIKQIDDAASSWDAASMLARGANGRKQSAPAPAKEESAKARAVKLGGKPIGGAPEALGDST